MGHIRIDPRQLPTTIKRALFLYFGLYGNRFFSSHVLIPQFYSHQIRELHTQSGRRSEKEREWDGKHLSPANVKFCVSRIFGETHTRNVWLEWIQRICRWCCHGAWSIAPNWLCSRDDEREKKNKLIKQSFSIFGLSTNVTCFSVHLDIYVRAHVRYS